MHFSGTMFHFTTDYIMPNVATPELHLVNLPSFVPSCFPSIIPSNLPAVPASNFPSSSASISTSSTSPQMTSTASSSASDAPLDNNGDERKIFIGGLSWETKEPQIQEYFAQFGEIESVNLKVDPVTGRSRCFAFLVFKHSTSIEKVIDGREHALSSKKIDVKKAKAKPGKIFVGGLPPDLEEETIRTFFTQFGPVTECEMPFDKEKNQRKNFCFVTFEREEVMKVVLKTPKQKIGEVEVDVKRATPRPKGSGYGSADYYGGMDQYYGYGDFQSWYGGGKATKDKSAKITPY
ncbi:RNA-binding protein squid isoform X2 [Eurytemora carolleeae]|uniref:RNA-binding protein squid isoform X2 n=1 Tax=Eurytemora carolleeae TaxID=1294199 RepID=UPI000C781D64|nr:RNA-binding protein squid isoform X2 [Eurytemora carolleeae]|eukprot:XP_023338926.1 RNA-binding protein squid-like isoform X2 [Eurytemora affinis]